MSNIKEQVVNEIHKPARKNFQRRRIKEDVVNEIHKPARRNFLRRRVQVRGLNDLIQADLVEMIPYARENSGYRYIRIVINIFSKYVWAEADVSNAMRKILKQIKNVPKNCQTGMGTEFYNQMFRKLLTDLKINHYSTYSNLKASAVERVNRTLKNLMWKQFSLKGNYKWLALLPKIVHKYNNTRHRTINMNKYQEAFAKGYTPNWSNEIFIIRKVNYTYPPTYLLADQNGQDIEGSFYKEELQKTLHNDVYLIEKVVRKKGNKLLVKWLGFDKRHNSWVDKTDMV
ncbi:hypothetical protein NQ315_002601 [Exocentrus adspersus]|uniref:Integrase catalytic domain-containing protein n=1 Tax=Exocentrus adspersus TaxID=1586481 RepID=A0AAV8VU78_9CUCU|nr:hypothetical protein NQ315_002601 [Exocentrus adspersus]